MSVVAMLLRNFGLKLADFLEKETIFMNKGIISKQICSYTQKSLHFHLI